MKNKKWKEAYDCVGKLGKGGNGKVFKVKEKQGDNLFALKEIHFYTKSNKQRFLNEIKIMHGNYREIEGVLPIYEYSTNYFWYTMPIAKPVIEYIKEKDCNIYNIISEVIKLAKTLDLLHSKNISHRDIKPANILFFNNRYYLGDFGIAYIPDSNNDITRDDRGLGAIFTIAPEMKRNPKEADGKKADVYSLAKTLWMLLTKDEKGFDGVYDFTDKTHSLRFRDNLKKFHLVEIEELLVSATQHNPDLRPSMGEFTKKLENYISTTKDKDKSQLSEWNFLQKILFGNNGYSTESTAWRDKEKIKDVLNLIAMSRSYNHMMLPDGGGYDLDKAEIAKEEGCLYIYTGGILNVVKPKRLIFESFPDNYQLNYFLLELDDLDQIIPGSTKYNFEELVEDFPAHYVNICSFQYGVYDYDTGEKLPKEAKQVTRYTKGKFLIVPKMGAYNYTTSTYDGRHNMCTSDEFRNYIEAISQVSLSFNKNSSLKGMKSVLIHLFSKNILKKDEVLTTDQKTKEIFAYPDEYISKNFENWDFKDFLLESSTFCNISFYLTFNSNLMGSSLSDYWDSYKNNYYLCKDGKIRKLEDENLKDVYNTSTREDIYNICKNCIEHINKTCSLNGFSTSRSILFDIKIKKLKNPSRIFNIDELENTMRNADDRNNNILVVNENGYIEVIQDLLLRHTYPVCLEMFGANNNYVGKYSPLSTLRENYLELLYGYHKYLEHGNHHRISEMAITESADYLINKIEILLDG